MTSQGNLFKFNLQVKEEILLLYVYIVTMVKTVFENQ